MAEEKKLTGYPSIDKPWLKYYSEEAIHAPLPEMTMYQYIWENNKDFLSDVALQYYGTKITYGKLFENIKKTANAFYAMGVRAGDIVTIMSMHTPETIYAIYGLNYIGAVANMVYMTLTDQEILSVVKHTDSKLLLVLEAALDRVEKIKERIGIPVVILTISDSMSFLTKFAYELKVKNRQTGYRKWKAFIGNASTDVPVASNHIAPAVIVYSSGTTGAPKGIVLNNDALCSIAAQCALSGKQYQRGDSFLNILPPFIGFGISMMHLAIASGFISYLWIDLIPDKIVKAYNQFKPMRFVAGPALVDALIDNIQGDLKSIKELTGGGGATPIEKQEQLNGVLRSHGSNVKYTEGYGMTESGSVVCMQQNHIYKQGSVGIPLLKVNMKVIDVDSERECHFEEEGELCFATPSMMSCYFKNEPETKKALFEDEDNKEIRWLHTGDLGYIDEDGFVFITGRIKRIFITRDASGTAYKLFPQKIEENLCQHAFVESCGVVVHEDPERMHTCSCFVVLKKDVAKNESIIAALWEHIKTGLSQHEQPVSLTILDSMPTTPSGKIDYRALEKQAAEMQQS